MEFEDEFGPYLIQGVRDAEDGRREDEHVGHRVPELRHVERHLKEHVEWNIIIDYVHVSKLD